MGVLSCSEESSQSAENSDSNSPTTEMEHGGTTAQLSRVAGTNRGDVWRFA
jgi:hypothetical protein